MLQNQCSSCKENRISSRLLDGKCFSCNYNQQKKKTQYLAQQRSLRALSPAKLSPSLEKIQKLSPRKLQRHHSPSHNNSNSNFSNQQATCLSCSKNYLIINLIRGNCQSCTNKATIKPKHFVQPPNKNIPKIRLNYYNNFSYKINKNLINASQYQPSFYVRQKSPSWRTLYRKNYTFR